MTYDVLMDYVVVGYGRRCINTALLLLMLFYYTRNFFYTQSAFLFDSLSLNI